MNQLAISLTGHDKGSVYVIVDEADGRICLADGRTKTLQKPKRKNPSHVQRICHLPDEVVRQLEKASQDSDLVHVLRLYQTYQRKQ